MKNRSLSISSILMIASLCLAACSSPAQPTAPQAGPSLPAAVQQAPTVTPQGFLPAIVDEENTPAAAQTCTPTQPDALGPFYLPGAPERDKVGEGYVLSGVLRSAVDCTPISGGMIEIWLVGPDGAYADAYRATLYTAANGSYRFESQVPPAYENRPPHIHLRASAPGYQALVTQHYPQPDSSQAVFDLVLLAEKE